jgi:hypothetical protein
MSKQIRDALAQAPDGMTAKQLALMLARLRQMVSTLPAVRMLLL